MKGRPNCHVHFCATQAAGSLWHYGEDALAETAFLMTQPDLSAIRRIAAVYEDPTYPLPFEGERITHNHVIALASLAYFEGRLHPLSRERRRAQRDRPARFDPCASSRD